MILFFQVFHIELIKSGFISFLLVPVIPVKKRYISSGFICDYGKRRNLSLLGPFAETWDKLFSFQCCLVSDTVCIYSLANIPYFYRLGF